MICTIFSILGSIHFVKMFGNIIIYGKGFICIKNDLLHMSIKTLKLLIINIWLVHLNCYKQNIHLK